MLSIRIIDLKKFTALLFTEDAFDKFCLHDASFRTALTTMIDGSRNADFYREGEEIPDSPYVSWSEIRPVCFALIRGSRLPVSFRLVMLTGREVTQKLAKRSGFTDCEVSSLTLNITYREGALYLTTGISYQGFTLDKTLEKYWDGTVRAFLEKHALNYTDA